MPQPPSDMPVLFKGRHYNRLLIIQAVRWYITYKLSYRDVCELMAERGVSVVHTTVMRGSNITFLCSRKGGRYMPDTSVHPGESTKPISV